MLASFSAMKKGAGALFASTAGAAGASVLASTSLASTSIWTLFSASDCSTAASGSARTNLLEVDRAGAGWTKAEAPLKEARRKAVENFIFFIKRGRVVVDEEQRYVLCDESCDGSMCRQKKGHGPPTTGAHHPLRSWANIKHQLW